MIEIKRWDNEGVIHSGDFNTIKECLEDGVKKGVSFYRADLYGTNLYGANLEGAYLERANLDGANLVGAKNILSFKSHKSGRIFYVVNHTDKVMFLTGCFWGSASELKAKIEEEGKTETHWDYLMAIEWSERAFNVGSEE